MPYVGADVPAGKLRWETRRTGEQSQVRCTSSGGHDAIVSCDLLKYSPQFTAVIIVPMVAQRFARSSHNEFRSEAYIVYKPSPGGALHQYGSHPGQNRQAEYQAEEEFHHRTHDRNYLSM